MPPSRRSGLLLGCLIFAATLAWVFDAPPEAEPASAGSRSRKSAGTAELIPPGAAGAAGSGITGSVSKSAATSKLVALKEPVVSTPLADDFLKTILSADEKTVTIALPGGGTVQGRVSSLRRDVDGPLLIEGTVTDPEAGRFMFQRQTIPGKAGPLVGFILHDKSDTAWQVRHTGGNGKPALVKTTADQVICRALPAPEGPQEIPPTHPENYPIPPDENGIVQLQSAPDATAVVYLDFDGEERNFSSWGYINALPYPASNSQIFDVWKGVCEDYQSFNLNVTTVRAVYDTAPEGRRIHVVITPTNTASPGAGGVAYVGSFNWSGEMVCWSFYGIGKNGVEVISHEVGHTLGLYHDGRTFPPEAYYLGHTGWAPIMGAGYYQTPSQWSKGEYPNANNTQDDLNVIANYNNDVGFRKDDHGAAFESAAWLDISTGGAVSNEGVIGSAADEDSFRFSTSGGNVTLNINNVASHPDLDLMAEIVSASGTVIASHDPQALMDASFSSVNLPAGDYFLRVSGVGRGDPATGYSDYASLGAYTVTGTVGGGVQADRFTIAENSANATAVGAVAARASHGGGVLSFSIVSGNTGAILAIDPATGAITVADNTLLDFETLSTQWDDPAALELFVSITDNLGFATELIRTVVSVGDANEPPVFTPPAATTIPEQLAAGSLVTTVRASDPDRFDHVTYSITGGNTGGAFAINPTTGAVTVAGTMHFETTTSYALTIRATDHLAPANTVDATLNIDLLDISEDYTPGTILRTFYNGLAGFTVPAMTGSPEFPHRPHSEAVLTSFDSGTAKGDSYGSMVRGYLIAPATGDYTFAISSDDAGELWISPDASPANAVVRADVYFRTDPNEWNASASQQSAAISLTEGRVYYIEARHKEGTEGDHVQVAWQRPGSTDWEIIPGRWLAPYQENYAPWAADQDMVVREHAEAGQRIGAVSFIEPDLGQTTSGYAITAGNEAGIFAVNSFSGDITVANGAALVAGNTHVLTITTNDSDSPPTPGSTTVTIHVLGLHEKLHAWWKLDESSGTTANDSSGNGRQAGLAGSASWIVRGAANRALNLNGTDARFSYLGNNSLAGNTSFTVAAWVKVPATHAADAVLIQQQESGSTGHIGRYIVHVMADGKIRFGLYGRDANNANEAYQFDITSTNTIDDGAWHHVACVRDGTSGRIFIDGVLRASGSGPVRLLDPALTVAVGYDARYNNSYLNAVIDDVRIYADALGGQQLLRAAGTPKVSIISPVSAPAGIPVGVGLVLKAAASDPNETTPLLTWTQADGPGTVFFGAPAAAETTAVFSEPGTYLLRVAASDGTNTATSETTVIAGATSGANIGPLVAAGADSPAAVNIAAPLTGGFSDDGNPAPPGTTSLSWSVASGPGSVTFGNANLAATTATCSAAGEYVLRLTADDGAVKTFDETTLTAVLVNTIGVTATDASAAETGPDAGTFTLTRGGSLVGDITVNLTLTGSAENGPDYAVLPTSVIIPDGATTATLIVTPAADTLVEGTETATLSISPGDYDISSATAAVVITDSNHAPEWTTTPITGADAMEGGVYSNPPLAGSASDPDGNVLTFSKAGGPEWLVVAADGSLSGTPGPADSGPNIFNIRVTDPGGLSADAVLNILVHFNNLQPAFTAAPVIAASAVARIPYTGESLASFATDPNLAQGDVLVFSKLDGPAWLDIAANGTLSGTPQPADIGLNGFNIRVSDTAGASADVALQITVTDTILYLDSNGTTAGSGAPATVTWDSSAIWSADPAGSASTWPWPGGAHAVLSAGGDAGAATITVDGIQTLGGLTVEEGNPVMTGGSLELATAATAISITGTAEIASALSGMGLVKSGPGILRLSGTNSHTGATVISAGALHLTGSLAASGSVTVETGATLSGSGSIANSTTVSGTVSPGTGVGTLTTGPLALATGARLQWQAGDWTGASGTGHDLISASALDLASSTSVTLVLIAESLTNFNDASATFTLVQTTSGITGFDVGVFTIDATAFPQATGHWLPRVSGNDLVLDYTPLTPFEAWQLAEFGPDAGNPFIAGEPADPDGDGTVNLLEYALDADPNIAGAIAIVRDTVNISGTDYLRVTVFKNPAATDITFTVQTTADPSDPGAWSAADTFIEEETPALLIARDTLAGPRRFIRLRVTR